ncbi:MAG TPA: sugar transferase [Candidatus Paceibacterota bacterium]
MPKQIRLKQLALLFGDILLLYLSLFFVLKIRYGEITEYIKRLHLGSFSVLFLIWLIVFYIIGIYEMRDLKNDGYFAKRFFLALFINFMLAVGYFYFIPGFAIPPDSKQELYITPRTTLFIFFAIFASIAYVWRTLYNNLIHIQTPDKKILLVGYNQTAQELVDKINSHPQLGHEIRFWMKDGMRDKEFSHLAQIILANKINMIVIPAHIKKSSRAARLIYKNLSLGIEVADLATVYESLFGKVPLAELEEVWFLENIAKSHKLYDAIRRPFEIVMASLLALITLPLFLFIAFLIKTTSPGSAFFTQTRVGKYGSRFVLWKFRTMHKNAEENGPQWSKPNDSRITPVGKFLRRTHLDELPQLINIIRGELSLIGPRPERPEFVATLEKEVPYYDLRHLTTPGITGWAQINYRYGSTIEDAYEKLEYDIYFLKNRSFWLDLVIFLKTVKRLFVPAE